MLEMSSMKSRAVARIDDFIFISPLFIGNLVPTIEWVSAPGIIDL
jgi:hypothetical protein